MRKFGLKSLCFSPAHDFYVNFIYHLLFLTPTHTHVNEGVRTHIRRNNTLLVADKYLYVRFNLCQPVSCFFSASATANIDD